MSEIKWVKITTNMFNDEKIKLIERMPEGDTILIVWIKLLVQAGKTNASGYIYLSENIPYTEEMLSTIFDRPLSTVRLALKTLQDFGMIEIDSDYFIRIQNWEKHQNIEGMERIREQTRQRVRRYRERKKLEKKDVTLQVTEGNALEGEGEEEGDKEKEQLQQQLDSNATRNVTNPFQFYQENFGPLPPFVSENIGFWIDEITEELVLEAMKSALKQGKPFSYAEGIMKSWHKNNIRTLEDVEAERKAFERKSMTGAERRRAIKNEIGESSY